jgi:hypothetical protein
MRAILYRKLASIAGQPSREPPALIEHIEMLFRMPVEQGKSEQARRCVTVRRSASETVSFQVLSIHRELSSKRFGTTR